MPWLSTIFLFWSYLSHFKSDFDCLKIKVDLFNSIDKTWQATSPNWPDPMYQTKYSYDISILIISQQFQVWFWFCKKQSWLIKFIQSKYSYLASQNAVASFRSFGHISTILSWILMKSKIGLCFIQLMYQTKSTEPNLFLGD